MGNMYEVHNVGHPHRARDTWCVNKCGGGERAVIVAAEDTDC